MYSRPSLEMLDMIARLGSFSAAAVALHKVPSAISYSVRQIEQEIGTPLFRRLPRRVELTPAGEVFIAEARRLLRQMDELTHHTRRAASGWQKRLKLTLDNIVKVDKLSELIEDFYAEFESAELQINMEVYNGSWEAISEQRADIVIGATSAIPVGGEYGVRPMGDLTWALVMAPNHPCAMATHLDEEFASQFPAICLDDTSRVLPKRHTRHSDRQRRLLLPNWYSAIECLKNGVGIGYMPRHIAVPLINEGLLVERVITGDSIDSQCCLVWRKDESNKLIQWMLDYLGSSSQLHSDWLKY
ncbi:LysR family transcriptional regulator [Vibrio sp. 10N.286.49.C2]|uniref:DNA-binding transcriptional activator PunR n=1 Tax=unclassified Vibrio TaxID=2614977 RepID=UPI000C81517A|nr:MULTISPECIES: DNA-binding transcriptional activator PunR [unclassified Vibrio]PMH36505.1 LysR family transcriptional regulator [Vibrio sp. 10N.286.49.C2]PMH52409.1 LysR family transcriptional regulator [Vibrio sp. 10N.286.49.B1]PMH81898.1 LysR family transcriptional regulator [Vibrio sp. 10N.286.48.B7]